MKDTSQKRGIKLKTLVDIVKYSINGVLYSVFFLVWPIGWCPVFLLGLTAEILGWVVGIASLVLFLGFCNSIITSYLWHYAKLSFLGILLQGFILLGALLILSAIFVSWDIWIRWLFTLLPLPFLFQESAKTAVKLVLGSLFIGFVGRNVAKWKEKREKREKKKDA